MAKGGILRCTITRIQNPKLTIRQRVEDLLSRMNIAEKVGQVNQHLYGWECYEKNGDKIELTEKLKEHVKWGGGHGCLIRSVSL